jgi:hypothetical protein
MVLSYVPGISLLEIHSKEAKTGTCINISTGTFVAALFIIAKMCKQTECPSVEWISKLCSMYTRNTPAIKRKAILIQATT